MAHTTVFRNAAWVVAWDDARQPCLSPQHRYAIHGPEIVFIGKTYPEPPMWRSTAPRRLLLPGLVNIHTHPTSEPLRKGITDETRSPGFWHSSLYEFLTVFNNDRKARSPRCAWRSPNC